VRAVDVVAIILAVGLAGLVILIIGATIVQIMENSVVPEIQLSDNATQILVGALGAFTGLLGSYIGSRARRDP
jgi:hypothetical protein